MKIWEMRSDNESFVIMPKNYENDREKVLFSGIKSLMWSPVEFETTFREGNSSDFPRFLDGIPIISKKSHGFTER